MNIEGGGNLRKPFRTTIDEDILNYLKKRAIDQGCNVNDIIELLVHDELHREYFSKHDNKFEAMSELEKEAFLARKLHHSIYEILTQFNLNGAFCPHDMTDILAKSIAQLALSANRYK